MITVIHSDQFRQTVEETGARLESGPVQINEDWPGLFIRGDEAVWALDQILRRAAKDAYPHHRGYIAKYLAWLKELQVTPPAQLARDKILAKIQSDNHDAYERGELRGRPRSVLAYIDFMFDADKPEHEHEWELVAIDLGEPGDAIRRMLYSCYCGAQKMEGSEAL